MDLQSIQSYINTEVPPMDISSKFREVQTVFNELPFSHIPIIKNGMYVGCISRTDAYSFDISKKISEFEYTLEFFHVYVDTHWLDILEAFGLHNATIMPVLSQNKYLGYYELPEIMSLFNHTPFLNETGGIIVVEKGSQEYSFSEICQIVESNGTKILGSFVSKIENNTVQVTIKVGHSGMNNIVQTFRRYNYSVISNHEEDKFLEDLKERSEYLDKYLNI